MLTSFAFVYLSMSADVIAALQALLGATMFVAVISIQRLSLAFRWHRAIGWHQNLVHSFGNLALFTFFVCTVLGLGLLTSASVALATYGPGDSNTSALKAWDSLNRTHSGAVNFVVSTVFVAVIAMYIAPTLISALAPDARRYQALAAELADSEADEY